MTTATTTRVYRRVADLPDLGPLLRDAVLYETPAWLAYCEASAGGLLRHVALEDGNGRTVALASFRVVPDDDVLSLYDLSSFLADPTGPAPDTGALFPNAVAAVSGAHCVLLTDPDADARTRSAQRGALTRAVVDQAAAEGCTAVGFLYLREPGSVRSVATALGDEGSAPFLAAAHMELEGGWPDFEGYLATLRSPRRNKIRRERRQFAEAGITTRVLSGTSALNETTARLQLALRRRYGAGGSVESIMADYAHLRSTVEEHVRVFLCELEGRPVGLSLALADGDRLHVRLAGFDYEILGEDFAYFNAVYYEPILWGIANGVSRYSFGTGTYGAKLARGCVPVPTWGVVRWPAALRQAAAAATAGRQSALCADIGLDPAWPDTVLSCGGER